jgi:hypothetical protein
MAVLNLRTPHTARQVAPDRPANPLDDEHHRLAELADAICREHAARRDGRADLLRASLLARGVDVRVICAMEVTA